MNEFVNEDIFNYLEQCEQITKANPSISQLEQITTALIELTYFLIEKLESQSYQSEFKIIQQGQEIEDASNQMVQMNNQIQEYYEKYRQQLLHCHDLEQQLFEEELKQAQKYQHHIEAQQQLNRKLDKENQDFKMKYQALLVEKSNLDLNTQQLQQKQEEIQTQLQQFKNQQQKPLQTFSSRSNLRHNTGKSCQFDIAITLQSIKTLLDDQMFKQEEQLYCCPSLELINEQSMNSLNTKSHLNLCYPSSHCHSEIFSSKTQFRDKTRKMENPYYIFFQLLTQCVKLNQNDPQIYPLDLQYFYKHLISAKIPFNKWYEQISKELKKK